MSKHAIYAPSSSHRWMACPGSIGMTADLPDSGHSIYTARGTVIHSIGELLLQGHLASDFVDCAWGDVCPDVDPFSDELVDEEMIDQAVFYCTAVLEIMRPGYEMHLEIKAVWDDDLFGTADCVIVSKDLKTIWVIDLKTGKHLVSPVKNSQLLTYAMMVIRMLNLTPDTINLVIVQPPNKEAPVSTWVTNVAEITKHRILVEQAMNGGDILCAGDHCQWCPAEQFCDVEAKAFEDVKAPEFFGKCT